MSKRWFTAVGVLAMSGFLWRPEVNAAELAPAAGASIETAGRHRLGMLNLTTPDKKTILLYIRLQNGKVTGQHGFFVEAGGPRKVTGDRFDHMKWMNPWRCSGLKLEGARLAGEVQGTIDKRETAFTISGSVGPDGALTGTCNGTPLTGWVRDDAQMKAAFGLAEGHDWPEYLGPNGDWSATDAPVTWQWVDRLEDARMVWFGEEFQGAGRVALPNVVGGMSAEDRQKWVFGGCSSPLVGGGRVYFNTYEGGGTKLEDAGTRRFNGRILVDGDEVIYALDAASGKTAWKQVFKGQTRNLLYDKHEAEGNNGCYYDGKVYNPLYPTLEGTVHKMPGTSDGEGVVDPPVRAARRDRLRTGQFLPERQRGQHHRLAPDRDRRHADLVGGHAGHRGLLVRPRGRQPEPLQEPEEGQRADHATVLRRRPKPKDGRFVCHGGFEVGFRIDPNGSAYLPEFDPKYPKVEPQEFLRAGAGRCDVHYTSSPLSYRTFMRGALARIGLDFWFVGTDARGRRSSLYGCPPGEGWLWRAHIPTLTAPGPDGAVRTTRAQMFLEGVQQCEVNVALIRARAKASPETRASIHASIAQRDRRYSVAGVLPQAAMSLDIYAGEAGVYEMAAQLAGEACDGQWDRPPPVPEDHR